MRKAILYVLSTFALFAVVAACGGGETEVVEREVVVEKVVTVVVQGEPVVQTVVETVEVPGQTVTKEVVKTVVETVEVPGQTVTKEVVVTVEVPGETIVVVATQAPIAFPTAVAVAVEKDAPIPNNPRGVLTFVEPAVTQSGGGYNSIGGSLMNRETTENLFMATQEDLAVPMLADSWELAPDLSTFTVTIKQGIPFHFVDQDWGELTAEDVAWSYNDANPAITPESIVGGGSTIVSFLGPNPVQVVDKYTALFTISNFDTLYDAEIFNVGGSDRGAYIIVSKKAFDTMGPEWNRQHIVGTGAFKLRDWAASDFMTIESVEDHWRITPEVESITVQAVPDQAVRIALLETGEADVATLSPRQNPIMAKKGFLLTGAGAGSFHHITFSGNYWEDTEITSGDPVPRRGTFVHDLPWIGNPWKPDDANNPPGMDDLEQARLVRQALARAIDRDLLNSALVENAGWPYHIYGFSSASPYWQTKWEYPYDPVYARQLLEQAGYPDGFEMPFFIRIGAGDEEIGEAVAGMWEDIGITVQSWKANYSTYRPTIIGRTTTTPWIHSAGGGGPQTPFYQPLVGPYVSSVGIGGYNHGIESRTIGELYIQMAKEFDIPTRIEIKSQIADYLHYEALVIGTLAVPNNITYNPNSFAAWPMPRSVGERPWQYPEYIQLHK